MTLVLLATLAVAVVAFVLYPVFALASGGREIAPLDEVGRERKQLSELKDRLYISIKDLDFEKASGKLSDADYESARDDYLMQVSRVMARLDELSPKKPAKGRTEKPRQQESEGKEELSPSCTHCQEPLPENAKFCPGCGEKVVA